MLADGHHLHPALHRDVHQPIVNGLMRQAQHPAHGNGGQAVVYAEFTGHIHLYVHLFLALHVEADAQEVLGPRQPQVVRLKIGGLMHSVGHQAAGVALQQGLGVGVIHIHHTHVAPLEQFALPGAILLKGLMLAGAAHVVQIQVGKHADLIVNARHALVHQPLAGNLHHQRVAACIHHIPEVLLQFIALRGGVRQLGKKARVFHTGGAHHAHLAACRCQNRADHMCRGGFAFGSGHADHGHFLGRVAEKVCAHQGQTQLCVLHLQHGHPFGQLLQVMLDQQGLRALFHRLGSHIVAVAAVAADAHKHLAAGDGARVVAHIGDLFLQAALHQGVVQAFGQLCQFHRKNAPLLLFPYLQGARSRLHERLTRLCHFMRLTASQNTRCTTPGK